MSAIDARSVSTDAIDGPTRAGPVSPFVGRGIGFPLGVDGTGSLGLVDGHDEIVQSIRLILGTSPGERPMRPDFGCAIHHYVFSPAGTTTAARIEAEVRTALLTWEPRIDLLDVAVSPDSGSDSMLLIDITYSIRDVNDPRNLVFPFYVIPEDDR